MKTKFIIAFVMMFLCFGCSKNYDQIEVHDDHIVGVTDYTSSIEQEFNSLFSEIEYAQKAILNYSSEIIDLDKTNDYLELEIIETNNTIISTSEVFVDSVNRQLAGRQFADTLFYKLYNGSAELDIRVITFYYYDENGKKIIVLETEKIINSRKYEKHSDR